MKIALHPAVPVHFQDTHRPFHDRLLDFLKALGNIPLALCLSKGAAHIIKQPHRPCLIRRFQPVFQPFLLNPGQLPGTEHKRPFGSGLPIFDQLFQPFHAHQLLHPALPRNQRLRVGFRKAGA